MALRIALFALMAVGLLGFGTVAWISTWPAPAPPAPAAAALAPLAAAPPPPPIMKITVLAAARTLPAGSFIKADDIKAQEVVGRGPAGGSPDSQAARAGIIGAMVRHRLADGQPILPDDVMRATDHGFLAAVLEPGMRAMTFSVADVTTDWALIWPGDYVDIILTQQFDDPAVTDRRRIAAETVIRDSRVIAVDRQLVQGESADDAPLKTTRTLTVELTPAESEQLTVAERLGRITLALRSAAPAPTPPAAADTVTWAGDVAHALDQPPAPTATTVRVFGGVGDSKEYKF